MRECLLACSGENGPSGQVVVALGQNRCMFIWVFDIDPKASREKFYYKFEFLFLLDLDNASYHWSDVFWNTAQRQQKSPWLPREKCVTQIIVCLYKCVCYHRHNYFKFHRTVCKKLCIFSMYNVQSCYDTVSYSINKWAWHAFSRAMLVTRKQDLHDEVTVSTVLPAEKTSELSATKWENPAPLYVSVHALMM